MKCPFCESKKIELLTVISGEQEVEARCQNCWCEGSYSGLPWEEKMTNPFSNLREVYFLTIPEKLYRSIVLALEETLEQPFNCTCDAYQERDTGAWIHDEEKCWAFMEGHIEVTLDQLKKAWITRRKDIEWAFNYPFGAREKIYFPAWAKPRSEEWIYCGWSEYNPGTMADEEADNWAEEYLTWIDHGEIREYDKYPEGYTFWLKEP